MHIVIQNILNTSQTQYQTKNIKNWYTIDTLGAIFTILDTFYKTFTILLQYFCNTITILSQYFYNTCTILLQYFYNTNISKYS